LPGALSVEKDMAFREIFITHNVGEIAVVKSLLDDAGLEYYFLGEHFASVYSLAFPARLFVREDQYEEALEILNDLDFGLWGNVDEEEEQVG
jgi:hypothetical protein